MTADRPTDTYERHTVKGWRSDWLQLHINHTRYQQGGGTLGFWAWLIAGRLEKSA